MPTFRLTKKAIDDLRSIARYTQKTWGRTQRNKYLSKLDERFHILAQKPHLVQACDEIRQGYRKHHVGRHFIFYRHVAARIEIIRILHERMDVSSHLKTRPDGAGIEFGVFDQLPEKSGRIFTYLPYNDS